GDPVGAAALKCAPSRYDARQRIGPDIDAVLTCEPDANLAVESGGVEIGVGHALGGQRPYLDLLRRGIDAHNGVLAAVSKPGGAVRSDDHAVRGGFLAE